jgi:hypothetical protein
MDLRDAIATYGESILREGLQTGLAVYLTAGTQESQVEQLGTTCVAVDVDCVFRKDIACGLADIIVLTSLADSDLEDTRSRGSSYVNCTATQNIAVDLFAKFPGKTEKRRQSTVGRGATVLLVVEALFWEYKVGDGTHMCLFDVGAF